MSLRLPSWLKLKPRRKTITPQHASPFIFLGEQDGPVERTAKAQWSLILAGRPEIRRAFLVRFRGIHGSASNVHVVLALCSTRGDDVTLLQALSVPYAALFHRDCVVNMMFVSSAQESQIETVCPPFYVAV